MEMSVKEALVVMIKFYQNKDFNQQVFDAGLVLLKAAYEKVKEKVFGSESEPKQLSVEDALQLALSEEEGAKGVIPGVWVTIGLFVLEVVLKKFVK